MKDGDATRSVLIFCSGTVALNRLVGQPDLSRDRRRLQEDVRAGQGHEGGCAARAASGNVQDAGQACHARGWRAQSVRQSRRVQRLRRDAGKGVRRRARQADRRRTGKEGMNWRESARARLSARRALRVHIQRVDRLARGHEQAVALQAAEAEVGAALGQRDAADHDAVGREDHDAVEFGIAHAPAAPQIAVDVAAHAVRRAGAGVDEHALVGNLVAAGRRRHRRGSCGSARRGIRRRRGFFRRARSTARSAPARPRRRWWLCRSRRRSGRRWCRSRARPCSPRNCRAGRRPDR